MPITKKFMVEDYSRLQNYCFLLERYFWNVQDGKRPDKVEHYTTKHGSTKVALWQCASAHGGYIVITEGRKGTPQIHLLDEACTMYRDNHSPYTEGIRICLERLTAYRNVYYEMHKSA